MYELIGPESYFVYHKEIEYLFAAIEQLTPFQVNTNITKVYGEKKSAAEFGVYRRLAEVFQSMNQQYHLGFLEFMIYYDVKEFTLDGYEAYLTSLPKEEFLSVYFSGISKKEMKEALESETGARKLLDKYPDLFSQYLSFQYFFSETEHLISMFFCFAKSLKTETAEQFLDSKQSGIEEEKILIIEALKKKEPFAYSEELMGKNCYNRGPYQRFYFMPAIFFPLLFCRIFENDQFLFYDYKRLREKKANVPEQLKAMADNTRYRILLLLNKQEHMTGIEIAKQMKLATSTVSHHMTLLRDSGLVHEEPAGSTKCYSLAKRTIQNCIKVLEDSFLS